MYMSCISIPFMILVSTLHILYIAAHTYQVVSRCVYISNKVSMV